MRWIKRQALRRVFCSLGSCLHSTTSSHRLTTPRSIRGSVCSSCRTVRVSATSAPSLQGLRARAASYTASSTRRQRVHPASQAGAGITAPEDLIKRPPAYPAHPFISFLNPKANACCPLSPVSDAPLPNHAPGKTIDITLPAAVVLGDLAKDRSSSAWTAPGSRAWSGDELHQLGCSFLVEKEQIEMTDGYRAAETASAIFAMRKRRVSRPVFAVSVARSTQRKRRYPGVLTRQQEGA